MAALLYFEEKVHRKKVLRVDAIPLLFPRLLCQILEHLGAGSPSWTKASRDSTSRAARGASTAYTEVAPSTPPTTPRTSHIIPSTEPLLHLSLGSPYPFPSIEAYATLCRH
ncbi:hypothetical protein AAG906_041128 [Vitis piasezkii]